MKVYKSQEELQKEIEILQKKLDASEFFEKEMRTEIQFWKQKCSKLEVAENLLHGYKKVIEDLQVRLNKVNVR